MGQAQTMMNQQQVAPLTTSGANPMVQGKSTGVQSTTVKKAKRGTQAVNSATSEAQGKQKKESGNAKSLPIALGGKKKQVQAQIMSTVTPLQTKTKDKIRTMGIGSIPTRTQLGEIGQKAKQAKTGVAGRFGRAITRGGKQRQPVREAQRQDDGGDEDVQGDDADPDDTQQDDGSQDDQEYNTYAVTPEQDEEEDEDVEEGEGEDEGEDGEENDDDVEDDVNEVEEDGGGEIEDEEDGGGEIEDEEDEGGDVEDDDEEDANRDNNDEEDADGDNNDDDDGDDDNGANDVEDFQKESGGDSDVDLAESFGETHLSD